MCLWISFYKRRSRERMNRRFMSLTYFVLSQTALIFYHVVFCLSRTFLTFFKFVFLDFFCFRSNFDILSLLFSDVKDFFQLFSKLFSVLTAFPDATLTSYHRFLCLSTGFFIFYIRHFTTILHRIIHSRLKWLLNCFPSYHFGYWVGFISWFSHFYPTKLGEM